MASSGTITINAQSVDAASSKQAACFPGITSGCCYGDCNPLLYGRGVVSADITLNWTVNDSGLLSFSWNSYSGATWYVCSVNGYHIDIDWSTDGINWTTISSSFLNNWPTCSADWNHTVNNISQQLISGLPAVTLTQSGYIRARMWTLNACPTCGIGDDSWPNAFPNDAASKTTAVPVHIDVNWISTLKYNANGGTGAPADQTHTNAASVSSYAQTVSSTIPTRSGYRFMGWADSSSATTAQYQPGGTVTIPQSNPTKTIYAVWTEYYRPGERRVSGTWRSHNRSGGACERKVSGTWTEMRTIDGGVGTGNEPTRKQSGTWYNQRKIGAE